MSIPYIKTTFPAPAEVIILEPFKKLEDEEPNMACIIRLCPEEFSVNAIISPKDNLTFTIQPRMPSEIASLWTIEPCFMVAPAE